MLALRQLTWEIPILFTLTFYIFPIDGRNFQPDYDHSEEDYKNPKNSESVEANEQLEGRIVGGWPVKQGEKPFQLYILKDLEFLCGATLAEIYGVQVAITSAHCVWSGYPNRNSTVRPDRLFVVAGDLRISDRSGIEQSSAVEKIIMHEFYDPVYQNHDLALLFTVSPFEYNANVATIILPKQNDPLPAVVEASGWGSTSPQTDFNNDLLVTRIAVQAQEECRKADRGNWFGLTDSQFCTYRKPGVKSTGICFGDSGGAVTTKYFQTIEVLVGVVSFTIGKQQCASRDLPDVHLRISKYIDWMKVQISNHLEG